MIASDVKSSYIGNWNCDDRRSQNHIDILVETLDNNTNCIGASSALFVSKEICHSFNDHVGKCDQVWFSGDDFEYDYTDMFQLEAWIPGSKNLVSQNFMHCLPIWRSTLHKDNDFFQEYLYGPSADWEFWMRMSEKLSSGFV